MRILFAGTPEFAAGHLRYLLDNTAHDIIGVFTQPDRPSGRGKKLTASPVKELALLHRLPVYQPHSLRDSEVQEQIIRLAPDIIIIVAYGLILPETILVIPRFGCLNVHASLLPRWRGAAPIQRAIEAGDKQTGITIMQMDVGLDTGDMLLKVPCLIHMQDTAASLHDKLLALGGPALVTSLKNIDHGIIHREKQNNDDACYATKITKAEAQLDWKLPAITLEQKIRAFNPFPVAYFNLEEHSIRVWEAVILNDFSKIMPGKIIHCSHQGIDVSTSSNVLRLKRLQLPSKKSMTAMEILNGHGEMFSTGKALG